MDVLELIKIMKEELDRDAELNYNYGIPSDAYMSGEFNMIRIAEKYVNGQIEKMAEKEEN